MARRPWSSLVTKALSQLTANIPTNHAVRVFRTLLVGSASSRPGSRPAAVEALEDPFYFALFSAIVAELQRHVNVHGELIVVRGISGAVGVDWLARIRRSVPVTWLISNQWLRAYRGVIDKVAYRSHSWAHPFTDAVDLWSAISTWRRAEVQDGHFVVAIDGIDVGDLISDSYLRFRPAPAFDPRDRFTLRLIWQARCSLRRSRRYFRRANPALLLTTYSSYLEHGIPVRVALQLGIPVYSFGSLTRFSKRLTCADAFHNTLGDHYRSAFAQFDRKPERLAEAERQLQRRLAGGIDAATSYMRQSAYASSEASVPEGVNGALIIFLHDFYDSVHTYPDLVFGDFWSWACFSIEALDRAKVPFFVKPHPNQIEISRGALAQLCSRYPRARVVPAGINTTQLARAGMRCGVTMYGTVAHELAYLGIPTIACSHHAHMAFGFCRTARTRAEYAALLSASGVLAADPAELRREALEFFYMHNLHGQPEELALRARFVALWRACNDPGASDTQLTAALSELRTDPEFARHVAALLLSEPRNSAPQARPAWHGQAR
jgi:hypothetical protein